MISLPMPLRMVRFSQLFPLPFVTVFFKGLEARAFFAVAESVIAVRAVFDEATAVNSESEDDATRRHSGLGCSYRCHALA